MSSRNFEEKSRKDTTQLACIMSLLTGRKAFFIEDDTLYKYENGLGPFVVQRGIRYEDEELPTTLLIDDFETYLEQQKEAKENGSMGL